MVIRVSIFQAIFLFFSTKSLGPEMNGFVQWNSTTMELEIFFFYFGYHKTVKLTLVI